MYICDIYQSSLKFYCQRFSNNANPIFTGQELLTVYLFCGAYQRYFKIKEIHTFIEEDLLSYFPNLLSYQANYRLNLMGEAISEPVKRLITFFKLADCYFMTSLIAFMLIIACARKNKIENIQSEKVGRYLPSTILSKTRQSIESFFN